MQWFKSAMVVSSAVFVAAMAANGCSSSPKGGGDAGDSGVTKNDSGKTDSGPKTDGGGGCTGGSGLACEQCNVSGFTPSAQAAPFQSANKCAGTDISAYIAACGSNATSTSCGTWQTAEQKSNTNCLTCIYSSTTGANWGPLVCDQQTGLCSYNFPGCIDIKLGQVAKENSTSTGSCGDLFNAGYGCQDYVCGACQTGADGGIDNTSFTACDNSATGQGAGASNECATYLSKISTDPSCAALNSDAGSPADSCFPSNQTTGFSDTEFSSFVTLFCGQ